MSLATKLTDAYERDNYCNINLICKDKQIIRCHDVVLKLYSEYFVQHLSKRWYNSNENSTDKVIEIDCSEFDYQYVKIMTDFMYGKKVDIVCKNVNEILHVASFYLVDDLVTYCSQFLKRVISVDNGFSILSIADKFSLIEVKNVALTFIDQHFVTLCVSCQEDLVQLSVGLLIEIIKRDYLVVNEEFLFNIINTVCSTEENLWEKFVPHIRFGLMNTQFFASKCVFSNILNHKICTEIFKYLTCSETSPVVDGLNSSLRKHFCENDLVLTRFAQKHSDEAVKTSYINAEKLTFSTDKDCFMRSVCIYGKKTSSFMLNLKLFKVDNESVIAEVNRRIYCKDDLFPIIFQSPAKILSDNMYTLQLFLEGGESHVGRFGTKSRSCMNAEGSTLKVTFNGPTEGYTDCNKGQFSIHCYNADKMLQDIHKDFIKDVFNKGYSYRLIHYLLHHNFDVSYSFQYFQHKIIPKLGLKRRNADFDLDDVFTKAKNEVDNGCNGSENLRQSMKLKFNLNVPRNLCRDLIRVYDEEGVERRRGRRLRRRQYRSKTNFHHGQKTDRKAVDISHVVHTCGPNFVWHVDGYDKLKPYGISVHACIDGFSRKVIWLRAGPTNKKPEDVAKYFISAIDEIKGFPNKIRSDPGTENGIISRMQEAFHDESASFMFGPSVLNQRIERWWGWLRQAKVDFWINHFKVMVDDGTLQADDFLVRSCMQFVYLPYIRKELEELKLMWNTHSIRHQKKGDTIHGIPEIMYQNPEVYNATDYKKECSDETIQYFYSECCEVADIYDEPNIDVTKVLNEICEQENICKDCYNIQECQHLFYFLVHKLLDNVYQ